MSLFRWIGVGLALTLLSLYFFRKRMHTLLPYMKCVNVVALFFRINNYFFAGVVVVVVSMSIQLLLNCYLCCEFITILLYDSWLIHVMNLSMYFYSVFSCCFCTSTTVRLNCFVWRLQSYCTRFSQKAPNKQISVCIKCYSIARLIKKSFYSLFNCPLLWILLSHSTYHVYLHTSWFFYFNFSCT